MIILKIALFVLAAIVTIWIGGALLLVAILPKRGRGSHESHRKVKPLAKRLFLSLLWPLNCIPPRLAMRIIGIGLRMIDFVDALRKSAKSDA